MKTIYTYNYNFTNLCIMGFIIFLLIVFIIIMCVFAPLLKLSFDLIKDSISQAIVSKFPDITKKERIITIAFSFFLYTFLTAVIVIFLIFLEKSRFNWIDTNISTCDIVSGTCEDFSYEKFESRDYVEYSCDFAVNNIKFSDVEIRDSDKAVVGYLIGDYNFNIYYREIKGKNYIVRIDALEKQKTGEDSGKTRDGSMSCEKIQ